MPGQDPRVSYGLSESPLIGPWPDASVPQQEREERAFDALLVAAHRGISPAKLDKAIERHDSTEVKKGQNT